MKDKARKPTTTPGSEPPPAEGVELPERWSVKRKTELVLRLLRGEALDAVSRESQVPAHELESWKRLFLELVGAIRAVLAATPSHGEGYRKVRARLAHRGLAVGGKRVLRLMRQHQLLAPRRLGPPNGDPAHAGTPPSSAIGGRPWNRCGRACATPSAGSARTSRAGSGSGVTGARSTSPMRGSTK